MGDIDELFFKVILPDKLVGMISNARVEYRKHARHLVGGLPLQDAIRFSLSLLAIFITIACYLMPFVSEVGRAKVALCGGDKDFSWNNEMSKPITLLHHGPTPTGSTNGYKCDFGFPETYFQDEYNISNTSLWSWWRSEDVKVDPAPLLQRVVLSHAFRDIKVSEELTTFLKDTYDVTAGKDLEDMEQCDLFHPKNGWYACIPDYLSSSTSQYCYWSYWAHICEKTAGGTGKPPGYAHSSSCDRGWPKESPFWCANSSALPGYCAAGY